MLIARRRVSLRQIRAVRQQNGGAVQQEHRLLQTGQYPRLFLQRFKNQLAHLLGHFQRQLATSLTVGARVGRQRQSWCARRPAHPRQYRTSQQMTHRCRQSTFGIQSLENHQPRHHPRAQGTLARELRTPVQHARHLLLGNRLPVSLECPYQLRRPGTRFGGATREACFFVNTKLSLVHLLSYRILEHFHNFMFSTFITENMTLSGITQECVRHRIGTATVRSAG